MAEVGTKPLRELVEAHRDEIRRIVASHHGRSVAMFGSVARGDESPSSDIDFLSSSSLAPDLSPSSSSAPNSKRRWV
jgi:predicted nucleotidyltransferase